MVSLCPDTVQNVIMHDRDREHSNYLKDFGQWTKRQPPSAAIQFSGRFMKPHYQTTSGVFRLKVRQKDSKSNNHQRSCGFSKASRLQARPANAQIQLRHLVVENSRDAQKAYPVASTVVDEAVATTIAFVSIPGSILLCANDAS